MGKGVIMICYKCIDKDKVIDNLTRKIKELEKENEELKQEISKLREELGSLY